MTTPQNGTTTTTTTNITTTTKQAVEPKHEQPKREAIAAWQDNVSAMRQAAQGIDWSGMDWSKLTARDIGVQFGPPMTEAQFKEYQKRRGGDVTILKHKK